jgi:hypothetical protein
VFKDVFALPAQFQLGPNWVVEPVPDVIPTFIQLMAVRHQTTPEQFFDDFLPQEASTTPASFSPIGTRSKRKKVSTSPPVARSQEKKTPQPSPLNEATKKLKKTNNVTDADDAPVILPRYTPVAHRTMDIPASIVEESENEYSDVEYSDGGVMSDPMLGAIHQFNVFHNDITI